MDAVGGRYHQGAGTRSRLDPVNVKRRSCGGRTLQLYRGATKETNEVQCPVGHDGD